MENKKEPRDAYSRTAALAVSIFLLGIAFLVIRPFLVAILSAAALAYIFYPLYLYILKYIPSRLPAKTLASMFTCLLIILLVLIPTIFIVTLLTYEARSGYLLLQEYLKSPEWSSNVLPPFLTQKLGNIAQFKELIGNLATQFIRWLQGILREVPNVVLNIFITIFSTYYFLKHGRDLYVFFLDLVPLPEGKYQQILSRFDDLSRGMILGQIVVGAVQGILAWLAFMILGVPAPALWGFLTAIISVIPLLGAALVWSPIVIYLFLVGYPTGEYWRATVLLLYGTLVISTIDNILKPKIVGERAKIHPLIILLGILGGVQLFGVPGILVGPLVLTLFDVAIEIYKEIL